MEHRLIAFAYFGGAFFSAISIFGLVLLATLLSEVVQLRKTGGTQGPLLNEDPREISFPVLEVAQGEGCTPPPPQAPPPPHDEFLAYEDPDRTPHATARLVYAQQKEDARLAAQEVSDAVEYLRQAHRLPVGNQ